MCDAGDGGYSDGGRDTGGEAAAESAEMAAEAGEYTADSELYTSEADTELYDPGYDHSEYEAELMDFSYEKYSYTVDSTVEAPLKNEKGETVDDMPLYRTDEYLNYEAPEYINEGSHMAHWPDKDGYDGKPQHTTLQENTVFARYGNEHGRYATEVGTSPEKLSMPYDAETLEYHEYRVVSPVECLTGKAKGHFDLEGGGTQYKFTDSFSKMVQDGKIERIK